MYENKRMEGWFYIVMQSCLTPTCTKCYWI